MLPREKPSSGASADPVVLCTLVLAAPYPILLDGLQSKFKSEPGFRVISCCTDGAQALTAVLRHQPDVLVLDFQIAGNSAFEVLQDLRARRSTTNVVLLADRVSGDEMLEATKLGVKGIVLKAMPGDLLVLCVRKVRAGSTWFERASTGRALDRLLRSKRDEGTDGAMTHRQLQITRLVASGYSNKEIAVRLGIGEGTVKAHLHKVYERFGLRGRVELTLYAQKQGLLDSPGEASNFGQKGDLQRWGHSEL